jgi:hypothetical protein
MVSTQAVHPANGAGLHRQEACTVHGHKRWDVQRHNYPMQPSCCGCCPIAGINTVRCRSLVLVLVVCGLLFQAGQGGTLW